MQHRDRIIELTELVTAIGFGCEAAWEFKTGNGAAPKDFYETSKWATMPKTTYMENVLRHAPPMSVDSYPTREAAMVAHDKWLDYLLGLGDPAKSRLRLAHNAE